MNPTGTGQQSKGAPVPISRVSADDFEAVVRDYDLIVVEFSKKEVLEGRVGTAVERLMLLSDTRENAEKFCGRVMFVFSGFDRDPREIYEIPAVVKYLKQMTDQWPFWYHFLEKQGESVGILTLALSGAKVAARKGRATGVTVDPERLRSTMLRLFDGMNIMYQALDLPETLNMRVSDEVTKSIERLF